MFRALTLASVLFLLVSTPRPAAAQVSAASDEFEDASTLAQWQRVHLVEGWNADPLDAIDIDTTQSGRLYMRPHSTSWYQDWRGPLVFKEITGDFVVTTNVTPRGRDGVSIPQRDYSLGGIMIRTPRAITDPSTEWTTGGENYVFLSMGRADGASAGYQYEVKTTIASNSQLEISPAPASSSRVQIARIGTYVLALLQPEGGAWTVHRRYHRADFPATLQVGLVTYTDWPTVSTMDPYFHNATVHDGPETLPDLEVGFDYFRVAAPALPPELEGVDLTDTGAVPDAALLAFLGANTDVVATEAPAPRPEAAIRAIAPNPFNPRTRIEFSLTRAAHVTLEVVDSAGRRVRVLASRSFEGGTHDLVWTGADVADRPVASGVYRVRLVVDGAPRDVGTVVLVR